MAAVSDSSPLILFAKIGRLLLLPSVFGQILIPPAVREEIVSRGAGRVGAAEIVEAPWITVRATAQLSQDRAVLGVLGPGEAEAVLLAEELDGNYHLLIDDGAGRRIAQNRGLRVTGSGGILVLAKDLGLIPNVRSELDALLAAGLYLSTRVYQQVLSTAGEWQDRHDAGDG